MDVLVGGPERPPLQLRAPRVPVRPVAVAAMVVLLAGVIAVGPVRRAEQRAADLSDLRVGVRVDDSRRELYGSVYGVVVIDIADPTEQPVWLNALALEIPGLRVPPVRGLPMLAADGSLALSLRFVISTCADVALPGRVVLHVARPGRARQVVERPVAREAGPRSAGGVDVLVACGLAPQR